MGNLVVLILLTMFMFALLGKELFGGSFTVATGYSEVYQACPQGVCADGLLEKPRYHYDTWYSAMVTIFILLTGKWVDAMMPVAAVFGIGASSFFISVVVLGKYLLMNLLIAVILTEFADTMADDAASSSPNAPPSPSLTALNPTVSPPDPANASANASANPSANASANASANTSANASTNASANASAQPTPPVSPTRRQCLQARSRRWSSGRLVASEGDSGRMSEDSSVCGSALPLGGRPSSSSLQAPCLPCGERAGWEVEEDERPWPYSHTLMCFGPHNPVRRLCRFLITQPEFDRVVIIAILLSSFCLALDSPRNDPHAPLSLYLRTLDLAFTAFFFSEMLLKVIAAGFLFGEGAYLRSAWNVVDFVIVMVTLLILLADTVPQLRPLRVLRVARVLRPLRLISRSAGMKLIITSLFKAMPAVSNVFGVVLALQLVFAILGMQLFMGTLASCSDPTILTRSDCLLEGGGGGGGGGGYLAMGGNTSGVASEFSAQAAASSSASPHQWSDSQMGSFDDFGAAMRLLYVMSSGDEWEEAMFAMMGAVGKGHAPMRNDWSVNALFPIAWMFVGYIFAINLFVGVVVDSFSRQQHADDLSATMTPEQQQWASTIYAMARSLPKKVLRPPADSPLRQAAHRLVNARGFDALITCVIASNVGVMACNFWGIEEQPTRLLAYSRAMDAFSYIYYLECLLKVSGLGVDGYFRDGWCRFDFFLVCAALVDQFATELLAAVLPMPPMLLRMLRVFRILRILRLLKGARQLRELILTMILSFPSLLNVGSLLAIVIFIYAVLGVHLFTFLHAGGEFGGITSERNFRTFGSSFLVLFQVLTGDGWSNVMADAILDEASGLCSVAAGDCGSPMAVPYFISFQILGSSVFLNLVVAVILENFTTLHHINPDLVSAADLELFNDVWADFDPDATNFIKLDELTSLLVRVPRPLGVRGSSAARAARLCLCLRLPQHKGMVKYHEVLKELTENNYFREHAYAVDEEAFRHVADASKLLDGVSVEPPVAAVLANGALGPSDWDVARWYAHKVFQKPEVVVRVRSMAMRARVRLAVQQRDRAAAAEARHAAASIEHRYESGTLALPPAHAIPPPQGRASSNHMDGVAPGDVTAQCHETNGPGSRRHLF